VLVVVGDRDAAHQRGLVDLRDGRRRVGDDAFQQLDGGEVGEPRDEDLGECAGGLQVVERAADLLAGLAEVGEGLPGGRGVPPGGPGRARPLITAVCVVVSGLIFARFLDRVP
jgi:hypothetical protein